VVAAQFAGLAFLTRYAIRGGARAQLPSPGKTNDKKGGQKDGWPEKLRTVDA